METIPVIRKLHRTTEPSARCKSRTKQPAKKRTARHRGNGFLNHQFKPFWGIAFPNYKEAEAEFFNSFNNLCDFYGWTKPDVSGLSFPQNISEAYKMLEDSHQRTEFTLVIIEDETHSATLATAKTFDTGYRLYYIPVKPVCNLMCIEEMKPLAELLISIYQYLYQIVGVSYYSEPCYLNFIYETVENWIDEEEDVEDQDFRNRQRLELDNLKTSGNVFLPNLKQTFSLEKLAGLIKAYHHSGCWDVEFEELAEELYKLAADYPSRSIQDSIPANFYQGEENERICLQHYLSFYWSGNDCLSDMMIDMVNNELQEMGYQEEPIAVQWFDHPQDKEQHVFDFEPRLFAFINSLTDYLNDYDNEQHQQ